MPKAYLFIYLLIYFVLPSITLLYEHGYWHPGCEQSLLKKIDQAKERLCWKDGLLNPCLISLLMLTSRTSRSALSKSNLTYVKQVYLAYTLSMYPSQLFVSQKTTFGNVGKVDSLWVAWVGERPAFFLHGTSFFIYSVHSFCITQLDNYKARTRTKVKLCRPLCGQKRLTPLAKRSICSKSMSAPERSELANVFIYKPCTEEKWPQ